MSSSAKYISDSETTNKSGKQLAIIQNPPLQTLWAQFGHAQFGPPIQSFITPRAKQLSTQGQISSLWTMGNSEGDLESHQLEMNIYNILVQIESKKQETQNDENVKDEILQLFHKLTFLRFVNWLVTNQNLTELIGFKKLTPSWNHMNDYVNMLQNSRDLQTAIEHNYPKSNIQTINKEFDRLSMLFYNKWIKNIIFKAHREKKSFSDKLNNYLTNDTLKSVLMAAGITLIGSGVLYATTIEGRSYKLNKLYERLIHDIQQFKTKYLTFLAKHRRLGKRIDQLLKAHRKYNPNSSSKSVLLFFQRSRALLLDLTQQLIYVQQKGSIRKELQEKYFNLTYLDFNQTEHVEEFILILEALMLNIDLNATVPSRLKTMLKGESWSGKFGFGVGAFASALWWFMNYLKKKRQLQVEAQKPKPKRQTKRPRRMKRTKRR